MAVVAETLDIHHLGYPFFDSPADSDISIVSLDYAHMGLVFSSNAVPPDNPTKLASANLTASGTMAASSSVFREQTTSATLTASGVVTATATYDAAPIFQSELDTNHLGYPFFNMPADSTINILSLDYALMGMPFSSNESPAYNPTKLASANLTASGTLDASSSVFREQTISATLTASATIINSVCTFIEKKRSQGSLSYAWMGIPHAELMSKGGM